MNLLYRCRMFVRRRLQAPGSRLAQGLVGLWSNPQVQRVRHILRRVLCVCLVLFLLIQVVRCQIDLCTVLDGVAIHLVAESLR
jgi:hypothetical protein